MVAGQDGLDPAVTNTRNDSTLVTAWPKQFDIKNDIFKVNASDNFVRELDSALYTRGLFDPIMQAVPSIAEIQ